MAKKLTAKKAKEILHDKTVHGKPITEKQRKYFGWIAGGGKAQRGTSIQPTSADSLRLYNMQLAQNAYYDKYKNVFEEPSIIGFYPEMYNPEEILKVKNETIDTYRKQYLLNQKNIKDYTEGTNYVPSNVRFYHPNLTGPEYTKKIASSLAEAKGYNKNPDILYYKDLITGALDPMAPWSIYDKRIKPQGIITRIPKPLTDGQFFPGNIVDTFYYDPLAVKPYNMLTPEEKKLRDKKYPKPVTTSSPKKIASVQKKPTAQPVQKKAVEQPVAQTPPPPPQTQYTGTPVYTGTPYSPGAGALVGFRSPSGDTTYIQPQDYERYGVPGYGRKFIESQKKQAGGKANTLYVSDPNDPRLQAYQDSSDLYNFYLLQKKLDNKNDRRERTLLEKIKGEMPFSASGIKNQKELFQKGLEYLKNNPSLKVGLHSNPLATLKGYQESGSLDIYQPSIEPRGIWMGSALNSDYSNVQPKQKVEYRAQPPSKNQSSGDDYYDNIKRKYGVTQEDVREVFNRGRKDWTPSKSRSGDGYYTLEKGGKKYKVWTQSGGFSSFEPFETSKSSAKKQPNILYVDNPNDPRLRAYQDSLTIFNSGPTLQENDDAFNRLTKYNKKPPDTFKQTSGTPTPEGEWNVFKKPVQPVKYRKPRKPENIDMSRARPELAVESDMTRRPNVERAKTEYSYTFPTFDKDVQKTIYFNNAKEVEDFANKYGYSSLTFGANSATATGTPYPKRKAGGKAQKGMLLRPITAEQVSNFFQAPQKLTTMAVTGKYQTPSEAMNIQNPVGAMLADYVLDPMNLVSGPKSVKGIMSGRWLDKYKTPPKVTSEELDIIKKAGKQAAKTFEEQKFTEELNKKAAQHMDDVANQMKALAEFGPRPLEPLPPIGENITKTLAYPHTLQYNWSHDMPMYYNDVFGRPHLLFDEFSRNKNVQRYTGKEAFNTINPNEAGGEITPIAVGGMGIIADDGTSMVMPQDGPRGRAESPNYVGEGYTTKGFNYNSAWGGRFQDGGKVIPLVEDAGEFDENGVWVPDYKVIAEQAKRLNSKTVKTRNGKVIYFDDNWQPVSADDNPMAQAGYTFLQPTSRKLPMGYAGPVTTPSTEKAISIGGGEGEPAFLIPTFKYGKLLKNPEEEFRKTGEHLGGPFDTWQEAERFGELRHQYVEKGQDIPSPVRTRSRYQMGGSLPGAGGFMYARTGSTYKKKAKAGGKMTSAYYQNGLDFEPKTIAQPGVRINAAESTGTNLSSRVQQEINRQNLIGRQRIASQPVIRQATTPINTEATKEKNKKYAVATGKRYDEASGAVSDRFTPSQDKMLNRASENIVEPMLYTEMAMSAAPLLGQGLKAAGKYAVENTALKNAYKLNPFALKENPEMFLYRARPVGQNVDMNMAAKLKAKKEAGEPLNWIENNILNVAEGRVKNAGKLLEREKYYGRWFEKDPSRLDFYINPNTRNFGDQDVIEILRTKLPKSEAEKLNVSQFEDASRLSSSPNTEYILPKEMVNSAERYPQTELQNLINQDKKFNTPHWLQGYKPVEVSKPVSTFKSEIDWGKWNPETPNYPELIKEYNAIEEASKADGTWMTQPRDYSIFSREDEINLQGFKNKLNEGSLTPEEVQFVESMIPMLESKKAQSTIFQGTPEQFIQQQSSHFKKAFPQGAEKTYRGTYGDMNTENLFKNYPQGRGIFTGDKKTAEHYAKDKDSVFELYHPKTSNSYDIDVQGRSWREVPIESLPGMTSNKQFLGKSVADTDDIATWTEKNNVDYVNMRNVFDGVDAKYSRIVNNKPGNFLKSTIGNVGFFDMTNPNIYKGLAPVAFGAGAVASQRKAGGVIEDDMGQWAHPGKVTKIKSNNITMKGVPYPVLGISDTGDTQMMYPEQDYIFDGNSVTEFPIKKSGGWLDKYDS